MDNESLYLFNPPDGASEEGIKNIQRERLDAIFNRPLTGEDIALKVMMSQSEGRAVDLNMDEFKLYDDWHRKQEIKWWDTVSGGVGTFFGDIGSGIASLTPFGKDRNMRTAIRNLSPTSLAATGVEALGRGTRDLVGLYQEASMNQNSPLYRLFNPNGDVYTRFSDFHKLAKWRADSQRIVEGKENVVMPNTSDMIGKDIGSLSPSELFRVNNELAVAGSYFLDPSTLLTLGESALLKAGSKGALSSVMEGISKTALKEGISGLDSVAKNTAASLEKGKIFGHSLTEKIGKSFRVAGETVDNALNRTIDTIKRHADELLDANIHTTPNANLRITGPTKGQAGFGGSILAGIGIGTFGLPFASAIVPIWAIANASRIGGRFVETLGKEMANGAGVLGRMGLEQTSTGKLARMFSKWGPMGGYVRDMTKAVVKSGAYGAGIGYLASGEEGAAQGLGVGMSIGTTHYHLGVANNIIKGNSKEQMIVGLINNINQLREAGFTQKADNVLKYLSEIQTQHGDDAFYRNLGTYLAIESDNNVALSLWDKADFLRLKDDPTVPRQLRDAIQAVIGDDGNAWNGLFMGRNGKQTPYFIHKDSESGKTHVVINTWAIDKAGKVQSTGLKGEFFHVLSDAYKEASSKPRYIEEVFEGIARTLRADSTPDGRTKLAQMFRNAADNLPNIGGKLKQQKGLPTRVLNHLKLMNEQAGAGFEVVHIAGSEMVNFDGFQRPRYRWISRNPDGTRSGYDIYEGSNGRYTVLKEGKAIAKDLTSLSEAMRVYRQETFKPSYEPTTQGEPPPNVAGQRERVTPEETTGVKPEATQEDAKIPTQAERADSVYRAIDLFERTGKVDGVLFHNLIEEIGEAIWDANETELPFDYIFQGGDLGFARNLIEEIKHRISRIIDREARQAGFVPDFNKPFVDWFKDIDNKAIVDPYMRDLFKKFLRVHRERNMNLDGYNLDISKLSPSMLKNFVEENGIEHEFDVDERTGNYVRKPEEQVNAENHKRYQSAALDLLDAEKKGIATGFFFYASENEMPDMGSLDTEHENGALFQEGWRQYRTTEEDIIKAQRKGVLPTKEELQQLVKRTGVWGNRNRPRTGEIDDLVATARKGSIIFTGIPTVEGFKILQKHLPKKQMEAIAQIAPLILDGGTTMNNVARVKYAGFTHVNEAGKKLKRSNDNWSAIEKDMVFYGMELRATLRNPKSGKFDYKKAHAAFLLHGVDINALQRRIQWMWKNERETRKRWASLLDFEKDVYRLVENYSAKTAIGGSRFFGGGEEGKSKKRLACAAIGAFPTRKMVEGIDADDVEIEMPEIDWHHYQFRSYGQGKGGRDIPWTSIRADAIRSVLGTDDKMRVPYTERAYYRTQEHYQAAPRRASRENDDVPAIIRTISLDFGSNPSQQKPPLTKKTVDWLGYGDLVSAGYLTPSDIITRIRGGKFEVGQRASRNIKDFTRGTLGHDDATDSVVVHWHGYVSGAPFEHVNMGQIGLHIGTLKAALQRNYKMGIARGLPKDITYDSVMPLVVNIKNPLHMSDRGLWTIKNVAESILASFSPDQRDIAHPNSFESASNRARIRKEIKTLTNEDRAFLEGLIRLHDARTKNNPNLFAQAQTNLMSFNFGKIELSKEFKTVSQQNYADAVPLHNWLRSKGIDSIAYWNTSEGMAWSYIIFDGKNAKNLSENAGEFSPDSMSMFHQHASTYGARTAEERKSLRSNWEQAILDGDIFKSISIRDNFLRDMPIHTSLIRQSAEEAVTQGMPIELYNSQFKTGEPVVLVAVHGTSSGKVMRGEFDQNWNPRFSHAGATWFASHLDVAKYFSKNTGPQGGVIRALIKSKNPLVIDFKEQYWTKGLDKYIKKAKENGHDSLIALNILDDVTERGSTDLLTHNQYVIFPDNVDQNIAVIDTSADKNPVPRGMGIINDIPPELPFLQQADDANKPTQEVKRTFYSAVEKFVQEKVTDKTTLQELMGLLDPTKGTGIVKSELEFLDIAGWVEEQKKLNPNTKAKVDKNALLEYIKTHKFELQEDKTNTAWYTLQGMDPNNPAVQSQVEGGYESYAPANKGEDVLHPSVNYRVLLLRAPAGVDYSAGQGGHFPNHENIISFARVSDVWLDRETEVPSPPVGTKKMGDYLSSFKGTTNADRSHLFERTMDKFLKKSKMTFDEFLGETPETIFDRTISATSMTNVEFENGIIIPHHETFERVGFILDRLIETKPELHDDIIKKFKEIFYKHAVLSGSPYLSADAVKKHYAEAFAKTRLGDQKIYPHSIMREFAEGITDNFKGSGNSPFMANGGVWFQSTADGAKNALIETIDLIKSYAIESGNKAEDMSRKKKMLFVMEIQSDNAQNMQERNSDALKGVITQEQLAEKQKIEQQIRDIESEMDSRAEQIFASRVAEGVYNVGSKLYYEDYIRNNPSQTMPDLYERRKKLRNELYPYLGRELKKVIKENELTKLPEYQQFIDSVKTQFARYEQAQDSFKKLGIEYGKYDYIIKIYKDLAKEDISELSNETNLHDRRQKAETFVAGAVIEATNFIADRVMKDGTIVEELTEQKLNLLIDNYFNDRYGHMDAQDIKDAESSTRMSDVFWKKFVQDKTSESHKKLKEAILYQLQTRIVSTLKDNGYDFKYNNKANLLHSKTEEFKQKLRWKSDTVVTEYMPFLRTEDFTKLMFKKLLREAVSNGYEGIIFIPPELPQKLTGGDSRYYYGKILPKVVEGYAKKFGGKLRENKSLQLEFKLSQETYTLAQNLTNAVIGTGISNKGIGFLESTNLLENRANLLLATVDDKELYKKNYDMIVDRIAQDGNLTLEDAGKVINYFISKKQGTLPDEQKSIHTDVDNNEFAVSYKAGKPDKSASQRGLILDVTPQMDAIKEGQPQWQAAPKRKKTTPQETVGDVQGVERQAKPTDIGERESPVPIPVIPKTTQQEALAPVAGLAHSDIVKKLIKDGAIEYRGFKILINKENEIEMFFPSGKRVYPTEQYRDKATGEIVTRRSETIAFPHIAIELVDKYFGARTKQQGEKPEDRLPSPAKVNPAPAVVPEKERAIPVQGQDTDKSVIDSQTKEGKLADYYGMFKIGYDPKMGGYYALDNGKQNVPLMIPSKYQSGPRFMQGYYHPDLGSVIEQLDKKFDKSKYQHKSPVLLAGQQSVAVKPQAPQQQAPIVAQTPVQPQAKPTPAPRRVEASSVPPAVKEAKPTPKPKATPTPKPKSTPAEKPKASIPQPAPAVEPTVVMPEAPKPKQAEQPLTPVEIMADQEVFKLQAMSLGKGFIEMLKDPKLSQYIIDSLNRDDNLTLKGSLADASTADGRFSVVKNGRKLVVIQNNYVSPITGVNYDRKPIAYVNTMQQAQLLIRRIELERTLALKSKGMSAENGLAVIASENPAFAEIAKMKEIKDNAFIQMLMSMRDNNIVPIYIDPNTLEPLLVMLPSEQAISQATRPARRTPIAGLLPENGTQGEPMPLALIDSAIRFNMFEDAEIRGLDYNTKNTARRFVNSLGYEILSFKNKFRLFNPLKTAISVRDDETAVMDDLINDIHRNGLKK